MVANVPDLLCVLQLLVARVLVEVVACSDMLQSLAVRVRAGSCRAGAGCGRKMAEYVWTCCNSSSQGLFCRVVGGGALVGAREVRDLAETREGLVGGDGDDGQPSVWWVGVSVGARRYVGGWVGGWCVCVWCV